MFGILNVKITDILGEEWDRYYYFDYLRMAETELSELS